MRNLCNNKNVSKLPWDLSKFWMMKEAHVRQSYCLKSQADLSCEK